MVVNSIYSGMEINILQMLSMALLKNLVHGQSAKYTSLRQLPDYGS